MLLIDTEGNSDQIDRDEVPPFLVKKTKDPAQIADMIEAAGRGEIKFPNGKLVETVGIDSLTVLWGMGQELAQKLAEKRASRKGIPKDEAGITQLDWGIGKRPIKKIYQRFNNSPIKFLVVTAREKALYEDSKGDDNTVKRVGVTFDAMKGIEYEVNVALHFLEGEKWSYQVDKVQGALKKIFPLNAKGYEFPQKALMEYAATVKTVANQEEDEDDILERVAQNEVATPKTQADLMKVAEEFGIPRTSIGRILVNAGIKGFDPKRWNEMVEALKAEAI